MYMVLAIHTQMGSLAAFAIPRFPPDNLKPCYTVQVLAVPAANRQAVLTVSESLRAQGRFVYYYGKRVDGRQYVRLRTGIFESQAQARAYADELREKEGLDGFIAQADVGVARFKDQFRIVTTPSGVWLVSGTSVKELYAPARGQVDMEHTAPQISPDGAAVAFYADRKIVRVTLNTGAVQILREAASDDALLQSIVRWSPDGRYLAYLDVVEWELPARLWIMRADGTENHCLVGDETKQTKVKSFEWHPYQNRIFYVSGPTHGTVSLGGSLCCAELDGTRRTLVQADMSQGTEILSEFRIASGVLQYRIAQHNPDGKEPQYSLHKRALRELD
jgi:hypothetical protein